MNARALIALTTLTLSTLPAPSPADEARLADHVVLISIDGLRPQFYLDNTWPAPMQFWLKVERLSFGNSFLIRSVHSFISGSLGW